MDGKAEGRAEWEVVKRIIALFYALARRADVAATRSLTVRFLVLWALRRSEPYALDYIGSDEPPAPFWRYSPADALRLARLFRQAARSLEKQMRMERRLLRKARAADDAPLTPEDEPDPAADAPVRTSGLSRVQPCERRRLGFRALDSPPRRKLAPAAAFTAVAFRNGGAGACALGKSWFSQPAAKQRSCARRRLAAFRSIVIILPPFHNRLKHDSTRAGA